MTWVSFFVTFAPRYAKDNSARLTQLNKERLWTLATMKYLWYTQVRNSFSTIPWQLQLFSTPSVHLWNVLYAYLWAVLNGAVSGAVGYDREPEHDHCSAWQPCLSRGLIELRPGGYHRPWQVCEALEMTSPLIMAWPSFNYLWTPLLSHH